MRVLQRPEYEELRERMNRAASRVERLEIAERFVPLVMGPSILSFRGGIDAAIVALADELFGADVDRERFSDLVGGRAVADDQDELSNLGFEFASDTGRAAYLLGLAVGMRLGRDAFTARA